MTNTLSGQLPTDGLQLVKADPPSNETTPSPDEVNETMTRIRGEDVPGVCSRAELLKTRGPVMICRLYLDCHW